MSIMMNVTPPSRSQRTSVMLRAFVFRSGRDRPSEHRVVNVSDTGLGIAQPGDLKVGMTVMVSIGRIEHAVADVMWARSDQAGLRFHHPIDIVKARQRRVDGGSGPAPAAGWLTDIADPYRR